MPVYTYRCKACGFQYDHYQGYEDPPPSRCPECRKKTLKKVFQPVGIVFKGSGFYATDHKSPSGQKSKSSKKEVGNEVKEATPPKTPKPDQSSKSTDIIDQ